jgi:signal transduction histidine kinase
MKLQPGNQQHPNPRRRSSFLQLDPNPIVGVNAQGRVAFLNTGAINALERAGQDAPPELFIPEGIEEILAALERREAATFRREVVVGDRTFEESIHVAPEHSIVGIFAIDVTERRRAEEARERLNRTLTHNVEELRSLIYAASHDLRAPLVSVQGFVAELRTAVDDLRGVLQNPGIPPATKERAAALIESDVLESLRFVETAVTRLGVLLAGLLRLARLDRASLVLTELDMNRLAAEVLMAEEFQTKQAGARLEISQLPVCFGDVVQVGQVLTNLVDNAIKYRDAARPLVIQITGERVGSESIYCVADNGIGIPKELHNKIFVGLFFRAAPHKGPGDGLGLKIVRRIADRLGGRVWVESEPDKGARFFFALPAVRPLARREQ